MNKPLFRTLMVTALLTQLAACRFGNYSEDPKPNGKEGYKTVDLYFTQARQLSTTVVFQDNTRNENLNAPLVAIPSSVRNTFTNPVYFAVPNNPDSLPIFVSLNQSNYISTSLNANGEVADEYYSDVAQLWNNPNCRTQVGISQIGNFDTTHPGTVTFSDGSAAPVKGHLNLDFLYFRQITGDCQADLQELANCYVNGAGCDTDQLNAASNLFDLYVRQTGVLNIADAIRVKILAYQVIFE